MTSPAHLNRQSTVDVVVVGAGLAGIYQLHRLLEDGLKVRSFEAADGVGGVWYWNRYPGARVDSHFPFYQYWFSKELWDESQWTQHFPDQREIEAYLNRVVDKFELRQHITFNTRVVGAEYDETAGRWTVTTDTAKPCSRNFWC
jgi:acetone monooxygenase